MQNELLQEAKKYVFKLLNFSERTKFEIIRRLKQKKFPERIIEKVVKQLEKSKLIDDERYAAEYFRSKVEKGLSPKLIKIKLLEKGIDKGIIDKVADGFSSLKEKQIKVLKEIARKKIEFYKDLPLEKIYCKVLAFLQRKGHDRETSEAVLDELLKWR